MTYVKAIKPEMRHHGISKLKGGNDMINKTFQLETVSCPSCIAKIEGMLRRTNGVGEAEVSFNTSRIKVTFDESLIDSETIKNNIAKLGYKVLGEK